MRTDVRALTDVGAATIQQTMKNNDTPRMIFVFRITDYYYTPNGIKSQYLSSLLIPGALRGITVRRESMSDRVYRPPASALSVSFAEAKCL